MQIPTTWVQLDPQGETKMESSFLLGCAGTHTKKKVPLFYRWPNELDNV